MGCSTMKIKLAYINVMDCYSGGEIVLQRIIRGIDKCKFEVYVYTRNTKFVKTLNCNECAIIIFNTQYQLKMQRGVKAILKIMRLFIISGKYVYDMKKKNIDIIHSNTLTSNIYFAFWAKLFNIKFIAHSHEIREGVTFKFIRKYISFCSDKIICVSNAVKNNWLSHGVSESKIKVIYNGVSDDFF